MNAGGASNQAWQYRLAGATSAVVRLRDHITPVFHNTVANFITLGLCAAATLVFKSVRDLLVPLWIVIVAVVVFAAVHVFVAKRQRTKITSIEEKLAEVSARLNEAQKKELERDLAAKNRAMQMPRKTVRRLFASPFRNWPWS